MFTNKKQSHFLVGVPVHLSNLQNILKYKIKKLIIYSSNEFKQMDMSNEFKKFKKLNLCFIRRHKR